MIEYTKRSIVQNVRIYEVPDCKMVSSGIGMFGDGILEKFDAWMSELPRGTYPKDFLYWDNSMEDRQGFRWLYLYEDGMNIPDDFSIIDFHGGLYAVATGIDQQTDMEAMNTEIDVFLRQNGLSRDESRLELGNIITSPKAQEALGYVQMDYWFAIKRPDADHNLCLIL